MKDHKETKYYYWISTPIYKKYKTITVKEYCDCCDSVTGSHKEKIPVGEPIRIEWKRKKKDSWWYMDKMLEKHILPYVAENLERRTLLGEKLKYFKV